MPLHFEFADSEVAECMWSAGDLELRFAAAYLVSMALPKERTAWAPLRLVARQVEPWESMDFSQCIGRLRQGFVLHASQRLTRLPVPCDLQGVVTMELEFAHSHPLHIRCQVLSLFPVEGTLSNAFQC